MNIQRLVPVIVSLLLLFNGLGALYGGWLLMADPSGNRLQLPLPVLAHTPFTHFLIPGLVLFVFLGVYSITALAALWFALRHAALYVVAEGGLLTGWILVQVCWTQWLHPLQAVMGATGLLLIAFGLFLHRTEKQKQRCRQTHHTTNFFQSNPQP